MSDDDPIPLDLAARVARQAMPDAAREVDALRAEFDALRAEFERLQAELDDLRANNYIQSAY